LSVIDGATANAGGLKWKIATLAPGTERTYEVRLQLASAGTNRIVVQSQAAASGTATSAMETEVEAVSNLKLVVNDPAGPTPTGESAVFELQVVNRGSQAARQVKIVMQFSDGVEPVSFEGCEARIVPGQLLCQPLSQLGPGEQATVRVKAKAHQAGSHHFRVEVTSADGDARLVSEGTTRFFVETDRGGPAASTARKPSLLPTPSVPGTLR
jgi:acyl-CoA thioesterase FadM